MKRQVDAAARWRKAAEVLPGADVARFFSQVLEVRKEQLVTERELAKVNAVREVALTEITRKYDLLHKVFERVFEERRDAINKHFEIIDKGIKSNDRELILGGLKGLGDVVASSPFANAAELGRLLEAGGRIEI
ncbi:hypothetical protein ACN47A_40075 [Myxococcus fulvus]|uniref:hypothetical protein n=1 Tax=Myxococcus fulvus TaxID=33 RepID=UPI003B99AD67